MNQSHSGGRGSWTKLGGWAIERSRGEVSKDVIGDGMMSDLTLFDVFINCSLMRTFSPEQRCHWTFCKISSEQKMGKWQIDKRVTRWRMKPRIELGTLDPVRTPEKAQVYADQAKD